MLKTPAQGVDVCLTVTLVDGYVLARSAFHRSMNYRSVTVLGRARLVAEHAEKMEALRVITAHIVPELATSRPVSKDHVLFASYAGQPAPRYAGPRTPVLPAGTLQ
jgi:nitroimidazol reductase NimA-like FMN-containing flavoprotein (pyridoxamine 5'-phosphate oxidase superfamily)